MQSQPSEPLTNLPAWLAVNQRDVLGQYGSREQKERDARRNIYLRVANLRASQGFIATSLLGEDEDLQAWEEGLDFSEEALHILERLETEGVNQVDKIYDNDVVEDARHWYADTIRQIEETLSDAKKANKIVNRFALEIAKHRSELAVMSTEVQKLASRVEALAGKEEENEEE